MGYNSCKRCTFDGFHAHTKQGTWPYALAAELSMHLNLHLHVCLAAIKPPYGSITDFGLANATRGWYDAQCQGAAHDYCRWINATTWSCALAGRAVNATNQYSAPGAFSPEYTSTTPCFTGRHTGVEAKRSSPCASATLPCCLRKQWAHTSPAAVDCRAEPC